MTGSELPADITRVFNELDSGDKRALADLLPVVYADLRRMADSFFNRERKDHTLQPTALVHEAYLHLVQRINGQYESRAHFFHAAAVIMRHILLNHARDRGRLKRGGDVKRIPLTDGIAVVAEPEIDLIALDDALKKLALLDARQARIVELRFFTGITVVEAAEIMGLSKRTVESEWNLARVWLWREMSR